VVEAVLDGLDLGLVENTILRELRLDLVADLPVGQLLDELLSAATRKK